ncbi:MAG: HAD-IA family hydrolase [Bacilli bacterium]|nr:HAD-IA family hydrolase [Bacilli bacterium]
MSKVLFTDFFGVIVQDSGNSWLKSHNLFERKNEIFPLGDIGDISEDEVFNRLSKMSGEPKQQIFAHFESLAILNPDTVKMLRELKKRNYKIVVLSNCYDSVLERRIKQFDLDDIFDDVIISYQIHMIKPHKGIFEYAYKKHCVAGDDVYFMDDTEINLTAPRELGWYVVKFDGNINNIIKEFK